MKKFKVSVGVDRNRLYVRFRYQGIYCKEYLGLDDTKINRRYAERLAYQIEKELYLGTFNYAEFFPNSKKLKLFNITFKKRYLFSEVADKCLNNLKQLNEANIIKYSTFKHYLSSFNMVKNSDFYTKYIDEIKKSDIEDFIISLKQTRGNKAINNVLIIVRKIFNYAYENSFIDVNIMDRIKNLTVEKPEIEPFTKEEVIKILQYAKKEYPEMYCFFGVLFFTGMRVGEVLAMKWENFDFNNWTYHVKENFSHGKLTTPKTKESKRIVKINEILKDIIIQHKKYTFMKSDFVFLTRYGRPFTKTGNIIKVYWKPMLKELGIRYRKLYQTRHTYAILSLMAHENPQRVARNMGHSSLQMLFQRYAKFIEDTQQESKLDDYFSNFNFVESVPNENIYNL